MDLEGVRTFVMVADLGQFQAAGDELAVTQQAVSRRIAALEKSLRVRLFTRGARGVQLTGDGKALLPHARDLLQAEERAFAALRPGNRPLRVDVVSRRIGPAAVMRDFHRARQDVPLEIVTLWDAGSAIEAVASGAVDATFRCVTVPPRQLPNGVVAMMALEEPHQLLTGPGHPLADAGSVTLAELAGQVIWIPGIVPGTEWGAYYQQLAAEFGLDIRASGPNFGTESLLEVLAESTELASLVGARTRLHWPAEYDLRRIPVLDRAASYPSSMLWRADNPHPGLVGLREYLGSRSGW